MDRTDTTKNGRNRTHKKQLKTASTKQYREKQYYINTLSQYQKNFTNTHNNNQTSNRKTKSKINNIMYNVPQLNNQAMGIDAKNPSSSSPSEITNRNQQYPSGGSSSSSDNKNQGSGSTGLTGSNPSIPSGGALIFVIVSFIVLMLITIAWLLSYYIQRFRQLRMTTRVYRRRQQLAKRAIARIPTKILEEEDNETKSFCSYNDTSCAICIENHVAGDNVRILPCRHIFHKKCIDPWLYERQTCPICKLDILKAVGFHHKFTADGSPTLETPNHPIPVPITYSSGSTTTHDNNNNLDNNILITANPDVGGYSPSNNNLPRTTTFDVSALENSTTSSTNQFSIVCSNTSQQDLNDCNSSHSAGESSTQLPLSSNVSLSHTPTMITANQCSSGSSSIDVSTEPITVQSKPSRTVVYINNDK